jgi:hypothetical protein
MGILSPLANRKVFMLISPFRRYGGYVCLPECGLNPQNRSIYLKWIWRPYGFNHMKAGFPTGTASE